MSDQKPRYYGDPNMLINLTEAEVSIRTANCFKKANIELLGVLLQKNEKELLEIEHFNQECLSEVKAFIQTINEEHKQNYSLSQTHSNGQYNHIGKDAKLFKSVFGLIFVKDDFEIVAGLSTIDDNTILYDVKLTDKNQHQQLVKLVTDGYLDFNHDQNVRDAFLTRNTKADLLSFEEFETENGEKDYVINVAYDNRNNGILHLAEINLRDAFAAAMNEVITKAQQRAVDGFEKRYGFPFPK